MSTFLPSPTRASRDERSTHRLSAADSIPRRKSDHKADSLAKEMPAVVATQSEVQQNAWRGEARRCSTGAGHNTHSPHHPHTSKRSGRDRGSAHSAPPREADPEELARKFEDWLTVVEEKQTQITTAQQTDLSLWFHEERLAAKTPFAAVVPCPASLRTEKARQSVMSAVDNFAFPVFYVQTLPMGAKLSEVSQAFVRTPAHLPEAARYRSSEAKGKYGYTTVACHNGADAMDLISRYTPLQDAVRDVPCLLLNDFCPLTPLCLRCLVVAGRCVAAEVACDEAFTPLFGIRPNNVDEGANGFGDIDGVSEEHVTVGERRRASAAARRRDSKVSGSAEEGEHRTASDVVAFGLKRFVEETLGASLAGRSYTALIVAEVKGFDPRVLGPRTSDPPFWPVMTNEPLHQKPSPFAEAGLRFYALSFDYADPTPFEAFSAQELHAVGDYVVEREADGATLPPILRFLDGHESERVAAVPPPAWTEPSSRSEASGCGAPSDGAKKGHCRSSPSKSASHRPSSANGGVEDTSSTVPSSHRGDRVASPRAGDAVKERPSKPATSQPSRREQKSAKPNRPSSPVKDAPIVLEPHEMDNRSYQQSSVAGRRINPADVDEVSSTVSSEARASSRLPTRTSSFKFPAPAAKNAPASERPGGASEVPSAKLPSTVSSHADGASSAHASLSKAEKTPSEASSVPVRDGSASVDRSETASTVSTHSSRLPEPRASAAQSSRRSSVARGDDFVTETESVRSSLPPRRRSSVLAPAAGKRSALTGSVTAPSERPTASQASVASTPNGIAAADVVVASSHTPSRHDGSERISTTPSSLRNNTADRDGVAPVPQVPPPLRPEDIPMVKSPPPSSPNHMNALSSASSLHSRDRRDRRGVESVSSHKDPARTTSRATTKTDTASATSATSSLTRSVLMSTAHSRHSALGVPDEPTRRAATEKSETASLAESKPTSSRASTSFRTKSSAVPPPRAPEALQYEEDADDANGSHHGEHESDFKDTASAYSSTYASLRSGADGAKPRDIPSLHKEDIPYINSPRDTPVSRDEKPIQSKSPTEASVRSRTAASDRSVPVQSVHAKSKSANSTAASSVKSAYTRSTGASSTNHAAQAVEASDMESQATSVVAQDRGRLEEKETESALESTVASSSAVCSSARPTPLNATPAAASGQAAPSQRSSRPATTIASSCRSGVPSIHHDHSKTHSSVTSAVPSVKATPIRSTTEAITAAQSPPQEEEESEVPSFVEVQLTEQEMEDLDATSSVSQPHARSSRPTSTSSEEKEAAAAGTAASSLRSKGSASAAKASLVPSVTDSQRTRSSVPPASAAEDAQNTEQTARIPPTKSSSERSSYTRPTQSQRSSHPAASRRGEDAESSVRSYGPSQVSAKPSEVPDMTDFIAEQGQVQPVVESIEEDKQPVTAARSTHSSYSSYSSSSSYYAYSNSEVVKVTNRAKAFPRTDDAAESDASGKSASHASAQLHQKPAPAAEAETLLEQIDREMSLASQGDSLYLRDEEPRKGESAEVDVDVNESAHASSADVSEHNAAEPEVAVRSASGSEASTAEESLVASAHSLFDTAQDPEAAPKSSPASSTAASCVDTESDEETKGAEGAAGTAHSAAPLTEDVAELQSTNRSSNTDTQSGLYPVNSADLHSCISPSVVSSQSTAARRWASGPTSELNYAPSQASRASRKANAPPTEAMPATRSTEDELQRSSSVRSSESKTSAPHRLVPDAAPIPSTTSHRSTSSTATSEKAASAAEAPASQRPASAEEAHKSSATSESRSVAEGSELESSTRQRTASPNPSEAAVSLAGAPPANTESVCAPSGAACATGVVTEDRDAALRKARLRAIAALIVANAAYEEVERVSAMYK